jgi:membrane protease subunit HflK
MDPSSAKPGVIFLPNQGPWGHRGGSGGQGGGSGGGGDNHSWGQGGGGKRGDDPDLDEMLRHAQSRFKNTFGNKPGGSDMDAGKIVFLLLAAMVSVWLFTGFFQIEPQENALILTFGKVTDTKTDPGLYYRLPWPVQEDIKVPVSRNQQLDIGFTSGGAGRSDNPHESSMLTGDQNIINIHFSVFWHIGDAKKYKFDISDPDTTVRKVAESAMRETIGRMPIQKAMTEGRAEIEGTTKGLMQKVLDSYQSGVIINSVQLLSVDPPSEVVDAFNDVQRARTDMERNKNEAETYKNKIVPAAEGDAQKIIFDAEAYKAATIAKAEGDADRFTSVYTAYAQSKDITQRRIYLDTMQDIFKNSRKVILGDSKGATLLPWLQMGAPASSRQSQ